VEISSVIEAGEAGEEACEDMVFIYVGLCLRKKYALDCSYRQSWFMDIKVFLVSGVKRSGGNDRFFCIDS
jgi:hypothetical protein